MARSSTALQRSKRQGGEPYQAITWPDGEAKLSLARVGEPGAGAGPAGESVPKQIIYPMRYVRPLLSRDETADARFRARLQAFLASDAHVIPLGRARAGIYLLAGFARREGRNRVVMLPFTIPDVVNMVRFAGCEPVFVDTLPDSTNVDIDHLKTLIDERTCCVLVTHYHVNQDRLAEIKELCGRKNVYLFDDCAIALEGDYGGARMGSVTDGSVFSMSGFKTLNYVWGGAIATRHDDIARAIDRQVETFPRLGPRQYRQHMPAVLKYDVATRGPLFSAMTLPAIRRQSEQGGVQDVLALQRRETERMEETVLSRPALGVLDELGRKLPAADGHLAHRKGIAAIYDRYFADRRVSAETADEVRAGSCFVNYPVSVDPEKRDNVFRELLRRGFHVGQTVYPNVHESDAFKAFAGRSRNVAALVRSTITLPTHPRVRASYAGALADALTQALCRVVPFLCVVA